MDAKNACSEAIKIQDEPRLYCDRAEAYMAEDMFDEVSLKTKTAFRFLVFPLSRGIHCHYAKYYCGRGEMTAAGEKIKNEDLGGG